MKKILTISIAILLICAFMIGNVSAMSCNMYLQTAKQEVAKGEEFTVDFCVSNIESELGVIALTATLDYDKTELTLVKMEGLNSWETPAEGSGYNSAIGKIAITRSGLGKNNEVIFRMTFKVNENATKNPTVYLRNVEISDSDVPAKFSEIKKEITLKTSTTPNDPTPDNPTPSNPTPNNPKPNTNKPSTTVPTNKIPQTGVNSIPLIISIVTATIIAAYFGIHIKLGK